MVALAVDDASRFYVAFLEGLGRTLSVWQGKPGAFEQVLSRSVGENPVVSLFVSPVPAPDRAWYAACGNHVWKFSARQGRLPAESIVFSDSGPGESILSLTGITAETGQILLASTSQHVFKLADSKGWRNVHDFDGERAVALVLSPTYLQDKTAYVLLLGGSFCRLLIR